MPVRDPVRYYPQMDVGASACSLQIAPGGLAKQYLTQNRVFLVQPKQDKAAKREAIRLETERLKALGDKIKMLYASEDILAPIAPFKKYDRNGLNLRFEVVGVEKLPKEIFEWAFALVKTNMQHFYEEAWGWRDAAKRAEMKESDALYLLAWEIPAEGAPAPALPVAMCHFRFEYNDIKKENIIYLYEIQAEEKVRNHGLGSWMMKILELLCIKYEMAFLGLTVFEANQKAVHFYMDKLKYTIDSDSPAAINEEPHMILSKCFLRK